MGADGEGEGIEVGAELNVDIFADVAKVDVTGQSVIIDLIRTIKDSGKTLIFSTHQLNEVRDIADHIVVMKSGEKIFDGNNEAFQALDSNKNFTEIFMELVNE